jgi:hypothetical protein
MSIWNIPEKYSNKIDSNALLDDIENLIKDYQTNIKNLYIGLIAYGVLIYLLISTLRKSEIY